MNTEKVQKFLKNIKKLDVEIAKLNNKKDELCKEYDKAVIESAKDIPTNVEVMRKAQELTRQKAQAAVDRKNAMEAQINKHVEQEKELPINNLDNNDTETEDTE